MLFSFFLTFSCATIKNESRAATNQTLSEDFPSYNVKNQIHDIKKYLEQALKYDNKLNDLLIQPRSSELKNRSLFELLMMEYFIFYKIYHRTTFYVETSMLWEKRHINVHFIELPSDEQRMLKFLKYLSHFEKYSLTVMDVFSYAIPLMKNIIEVHPQHLYLFGGDFTPDILKTLEECSFQKLVLQTPIVHSKLLKFFLNVNSETKKIIFKQMILNDENIFILNPRCEDITFLKENTSGIQPLSQNVIVYLSPRMDEIFKFRSNISQIILSTQSEIAVKDLTLKCPNEFFFKKLLSNCTALEKLNISVVHMCYNSIIFLMQDNIRETLEKITISTSREFFLKPEHYREIKKFFVRSVKFMIQTPNPQYNKAQRRRTGCQRKHEYIPFNVGSRTGGRN